MTIQSQLKELADLAHKTCLSEGTQVWNAMEKAGHLHLRWNTHLRANHLTGTADSLLIGAGAAAREAAACVSLGLVRPALNSLRAQIDLNMAWLYFKDHPIEWKFIQATGDNFKLKKDLLEYFRIWSPSFGQRWGILTERSTRPPPDPYRILSAHMHGQSEHVIPVVEKPADLVAPASLRTDAVTLQEACSEYISDLFWCLFADEYQSIPTDLQEALVQRFKNARQRATFFKR
ncbi:hypothetical protein [Xanthomonas campestris]|uniref:hypothetical protein n=1 Tax=Xanthomonas campestris TaxID=339 RepID=UPI001C865726|nr:hypothetical protein [Xanthomonas campestris]MCC5051995.1 hypothetical protein [Xanthomonas campestris pv. aberrans]MDM7683146.1 hypothetical protein [Xanthomonas campestris pv. campestris]MDM7710476.1 hypothetical protein [Xanthomonas campestris pv. campestris]MDO0858527.1 hypothetical protein [Xanthomonas campestris pv. campestris]MEA9472465.1 hypothetical protein [Xanthomonas campestris]